MRMRDWKVGSGMAGVVAGVLVGFVGCTSKPAKMPLPSLSAPISVQLTAPALNLTLRPPNPLFPWMAAGEFYPPGCTPITPPGYRAPKLFETPGAWFPSTDECVSSNGERTLYHLAAPGSTTMDYVVFLRNNAARSSRAVFQIRKALEVLWSPDNSRVAITVLTGGNNAAVVLLRMDDLKASEPIPTDEALHGYLSQYLIEAPQFVMALGWTTTGELVLRARGHEALAPYSLFGYELLVDTDRIGKPDAVRFLRGYINAPNRDAK